MQLVNIKIKKQVAEKIEKAISEKNKNKIHTPQ